MIGENDLVIFTQRPLLGGLAPVLIKGGGTVNRRLHFANRAIGRVFNAVTDKGFSVGSILAGVVSPALQNIVFHQMRRVIIGHGFIVAPTIHGDVARTTVFFKAITDHPVLVAIMPAGPAHIVILTAFPTHTELTLRAQRQRRRAAIFPMGKEKIAHMASGVAIGD